MPQPEVYQKIMPKRWLLVVLIAAAQSIKALIHHHQVKKNALILFSRKSSAIHKMFHILFQKKHPYYPDCFEEVAEPSNDRLRPILRNFPRLNGLIRKQYICIVLEHKLVTW